MSGITFIRRDWGDVVAIVRIVTTDSLSTAGTANYITKQASNIATANESTLANPFDWQASDVVLVSASDGWSLFNINSTFTTLTPLTTIQQTAVNLTATQIKALYDTPVLAVAAPAAGTINLVRHAYLVITFNSAQYAAGGVLALQYKNTVHGGGTAASSTISAATLNGVAANEILEFSAPSTILTANATGQAIYLSNATGDFTTGDSAAVLYTYYQNISAPT